jgi:hypothetical protein
VIGVTERARDYQVLSIKRYQSNVSFATVVLGAAGYLASVINSHNKKWYSLFPQQSFFILRSRPLRRIHTMDDPFDRLQKSLESSGDISFGGKLKDIPADQLLLFFRDKKKNTIR